MKTSTEVIKHLVYFKKEIESLTIVQFPDTSSLQERFHQFHLIENAINHALALRSAYSFPFWDGLLNSQFDSNLYAPGILEEAMVHNEMISRFTVKRDELERLDELSSSANANYGINSAVECSDGVVRHFVLFDFHIPNHPDNVVCVERLVRLLGVTGYLLETNKSYHFFSDGLVSQEKLRHTLYQALLFTPIIDKNWIAHQLIESSCTLRITPKDNQVPFLIKTIR